MARRIWSAAREISMQKYLMVKCQGAARSPRQNRTQSPPKIDLIVSLGKNLGWGLTGRGESGHHHLQFYVAVELYDGSLDNGYMHLLHALNKQYLKN